MASLSNSVMTFVVLLSLMLAATDAAMTCSEATTSLSPCISYLTTINTTPTSNCCNGVRTIAATVTGQQERISVCSCLKNAANHISNLIDDQATALPGHCAVVLPFPISRNINCNREREDGAKVKRVANLNNPYMKNQNPNWRFRLSLNKLYAWNLVEYDRVVMLDADNLFLKKTDELFHCGQFCAVFINPCIFHTGLFVLQPSTTVFKDMLHQLEIEKDNPDGADQGFIGGYFPDLLDTPMFHPPSNGTKLNGHFRLPLGYQMDASYFYLRLKWNIPCGPNSVITYPGAPWLKPWYWWSWPVLPLGITWHEQRRSTLGYGAELPFVTIQSVFYLLMIAMTRLARPNFSKLCYRRTDKNTSFIQTSLKVLAVLSILGSYIVPFFLIPHTIHPIIGWSLYLLGAFAFSTIAINAFMLPVLAVMVPWIGILGTLLVMACPWYSDGVVRCLAVFVYAFCCAPFLWVATTRVMASLQMTVEREAFLPRIAESNPTPSFNKLY